MVVQQMPREQRQQQVVVQVQGEHVGTRAHAGGGCRQQEQGSGGVLATKGEEQLGLVVAGATRSVWAVAPVAPTSAATDDTASDLLTAFCGQLMQQSTMVT
jgi:hypothetical protein